MVGLFDAITTPLKNAGELAQNILEIRDQIKLGELQVKLQAQIMAALQGATAAQAHELAMGDEIRQLKALIVELETWEAEKKRYVLKELPPGIFVYALKDGDGSGEPPHQLCQNCYHNRQKSILHRTEVNNGIYHLRCDACKADQRVGKFSAPDINDGRRSGGPHSWMR